MASKVDVLFSTTVKDANEQNLEYKLGLELERGAKIPPSTLFNSLEEIPPSVIVVIHSIVGFDHFTPDEIKAQVIENIKTGDFKLYQLDEGSTDEDYTVLGQTYPANAEGTVPPTAVEANPAEESPSDEDEEEVNVVPVDSVVTSDENTEEKPVAKSTKASDPVQETPEVEAAKAETETETQAPSTPAETAPAAPEAVKEKAQPPAETPAPSSAATRRKELEEKMAQMQAMMQSVQSELLSLNEAEEKTEEFRSQFETLTSELTVVSEGIYDLELTEDAVDNNGEEVSPEAIESRKQTLSEIAPLLEKIKVILSNPS